MTETVPERIWAIPAIGGDWSDGMGMWTPDNQGAGAVEYVPATALEAAQARIVELQDRVLLAYNLAKKAEDFRKTARREALKEVEQAFLAECIPGERRPLSSILDTIRALMEKPNENG